MSMRRCKEFHMIETIYEEEEEEDYGHNISISLSSLSPSTLSSPSTFSPSSPLLSIVDKWTKSTGQIPDVIILVCGHCFHLHRVPLSSRSGYLKRRLAEADDVTVTPPLNITAESFTDAARFCYGRTLKLTPLNLAAVRIAAELLEMSGLIRQAEEFFRREVAGDVGNAAVVLRASAGLLQAAGETAASLGARCAVVLAAEEEDADGEWAGDLMDLPAAEFGMIAESWAKWSLHDHDLLYRTVDQYLQVNEEKMVSEEEKMDICSTINCRALSHISLLHLLHNSTVPLRFVLHVGELEARRCSASSSSSSSILMDAAALRIESLERDVAGLRRHLRWSEEKRTEMESARSESFRFVPPPLKKPGRGFRRRLLHGLRSIFRPSAEAEADSRE